MPVPPFLLPWFRYDSYLGVASAPVALANIRNSLITQPPLMNPPQTPWTEPTTNRFISPTDASGRFMDITFTTTAQANTLLQFQVKNSSGTELFHRSIGCGGGVELRVFAGERHLWVESVQATPETAQASLLDMYPRSNTYHSNWLVGNGYKDTFGNASASDIQADRYFSFDNGVATSHWRAVGETTGVGALPMLDASGFTIHRPVTIAANMSGVIRRIGRLYHAYMVDASLAFGAELDIPINDNPLQVGTFKVLGKPTSSIGAFRVALRKA